MADIDRESQNTEENVTTSGVFRVWRAVLVLIVGALVGYFVYTTTVAEQSRFPFQLGLDLAGGSHLVYEADTSQVNQEDISELMQILRDVIERRVREKAYGAAEPIVQVSQSSVVSGDVKHRLIVELPGVTDIEQAVAEIGKTPLLEFKLVNQQAAIAQSINLTTQDENGATSTQSAGTGTSSEVYIDTGLTGRYLDSAELVFGQGSGGLSNEPIVSVKFTGEGAELFKKITTEHTGEFLAIFLDGEVVSEPRINEPIPGGQAVISGNFTPDEARDLVQNLNFGALPLPIELQSTQTIGASLGAEILGKGMAAGAIGLVLVMLFMTLWYRLPGAVAVIALVTYGAIMLALFKLIPVTLTAAGLAGFILSIGMAVDANVLVFERMKEEYRGGKRTREAAAAGFARAWSAIRDGNVTSILSAAILFWFGTSIVQGFALVFGVGVLVSMFTAIVVTRSLLLALPDVSHEDRSLLSRLFDSGFTK